MEKVDLPEYARAVDAEDGGGNLLIRLHAPRFVAAATNDPLSKDAVEFSCIYYGRMNLSIVDWIDPRPSDAEVTGYLDRLREIWGHHAMSLFSDC
jgi:hypothetical protein